MKLYNSLTKDLQDITPLDGKTVRIYSCGPTVYDHAHIGNLSSFIIADTIRRAIKTLGQDVKHVMNYTDVDDKIIQRTQKLYPQLSPNEALSKLTTHYIDLFMQDMQAIGNDIDAITFLRATDSIKEMQQLITRLHQQGFAYIADDGIYFSIEAYRKSGKTYGQLVTLTEQNTSNARIQNDEYDKETVHDFALWKAQKDNEPAWDFTLDGTRMPGRPGWHIECSAMSHSGLGEPFDVHTGGIDLLFPHHENEIAQSTAGKASPVMAKAFVHNEHILVDGKKMSKSANNFYTLEDIKAKGFHPLAFRLMVLQSHYRNQVHFSWENLQAAHNRLQRFQAFADLRWQPLPDGQTNRLTHYQNCTEVLLEHLGNNLNTPLALSLISEVSQDPDQSVSTESISHFIKFLETIDQALGLQLLDSTDITQQQKQLITKRKEARANKDFVQADALRQQLRQQSIEVRDTPHGPIWYRTV